MNLVELKSLTETVLEWTPCCEDRGCTCQEHKANWRFAVTPELVLAMLSLIEQQNAALKYNRDVHMTDIKAYKLRDAALDSYQEFNNESKT